MLEFKQQTEKVHSISRDGKYLPLLIDTWHGYPELIFCAEEEHYDVEISFSKEELTQILKMM